MILQIFLLGEGYNGGRAIATLRFPNKRFSCANPYQMSQYCKGKNGGNANIITASFHYLQCDLLSFVFASINTSKASHRNGAKFCIDLDVVQ